MLKIAVIAGSYAEGHRFIKYKFKDAIHTLNNATSVYTLKNGDTLHLCYNVDDNSHYETMNFDAFVITPMYDTLLDRIRRRAERIV